MNHPLLNLSQFVQDHPPRDYGAGQWQERENHEMFLRPGTRVRIAVDHTADIGFGLWRNDKLAEAGISANDVDSLAFAEQLNATLGQQLSSRNLEHLIQVFARELASAELARQQALPKAA